MTLMTTIELDAYLTRIGLPNNGRRLVEKARREAPVRQVQSKGGNVITGFQSVKMDRTIETESRGGEYPAVISYEHDKSVLEYYPQPMTIDVPIVNSEGRQTTRRAHTPDFMLLREDRISIEEWRPEATMIKKAKEQPGRFERDERGWRFPEIESLLHALGIEYRLRMAEEHPAIFIQNVIFLRDYFSPNTEPLDTSILGAIKQCFVENAFLSLSELIAMGTVSQHPAQG